MSAFLLGRDSVLVFASDVLYACLWLRKIRVEQTLHVLCHRFVNCLHSDDWIYLAYSYINICVDLSFFYTETTLLLIKFSLSSCWIAREWVRAIFHGVTKSDMMVQLQADADEAKREVIPDQLWAVKKLADCKFWFLDSGVYSSSFFSLAVQWLIADTLCMYRKARNRTAHLWITSCICLLVFVLVYEDQNKVQVPSLLTGQRFVRNDVNVE